MVDFRAEQYWLSSQIMSGYCRHSSVIRDYDLRKPQCPTRVSEEIWDRSLPSTRAMSMVCPPNNIPLLIQEPGAAVAPVPTVADLHAVYEGFKVKVGALDAEERVALKGQFAAKLDEARYNGQTDAVIYYRRLLSIIDQTPLETKAQQGGPDGPVGRFVDWLRALVR